MTTKIEWTHRPGTTGVTWNPTRGCRRVSPGCGTGTAGGCYAERQAARFSGPGQPYEGLVEIGKHGPRWTGRGRVVADKLAEPLRWRKPRTVFVDSMSDLFFEGFAFEQIAAVFGVMAATPQHAYLVLTKRPERARAFFEWATARCADHRGCERDTLHRAAVDAIGNGSWERPFFDQYAEGPLP